MTRFALLLSALLAVGCNQPSDDLSPDQPAEIEAVHQDEDSTDLPKEACSEPLWREGAAGLEVATKAFLQDGALVVGVIAIEDSRCPEGVQCVWAGEATATLAIQSDGDVVVRRVRERESTDFEGYRITVMDISAAETPEVILGLFEFEAVACPVTI